jgi:hypothetical protein
MFATLFAAHDHRRVLIAIDGSRVELIDLVANRRQELYNLRYARSDLEQPREPTLDEIAMLLLAESRIGSLSASRRMNTGYLLSGSGFSTAVRGSDEKGKLYRAIAIAWLNSRNEPRDMYNAISIATNLDLTDQACGLAAGLLAMPGVNSRYRSRAATSLLSIGNQTHVPLLEKLFDNTIVVASVSGTSTIQGVPVEVYYEIELRDLGLAISILLAGKNPDDYGFADRYPDSPDDGQSFSSSRYYFLNEKARKTAFAKWGEAQKPRDRGP